jgi:hypothetical protein
LRHLKDVEQQLRGDATTELAATKSQPFSLLSFDQPQAFTFLGFAGRNQVGVVPNAPLLIRHDGTVRGGLWEVHTRRIPCCPPVYQVQKIPQLATSLRAPLGRPCGLLLCHGGSGSPATLSRGATCSTRCARGCQRAPARDRARWRKSYVLLEVIENAIKEAIGDLILLLCAARRPNNSEKDKLSGSTPDYICKSIEPCDNSFPGRDCHGKSLNHLARPSETFRQSLSVVRIRLPVVPRIYWRNLVRADGGQGRRL